MDDNTHSNSSDLAFEALFELFSDERLLSHRHRRCPIDQPPTGFDEVWNSIMDDLYGRNIEYALWANDLRQNDLIAWRPAPVSRPYYPQSELSRQRA